MENQPKGPKGGFLCDEMGLGKTIQIISTILDNPKPRTLIVVPKTIVTQWSTEIAKFAPGLSVLVYDGPERTKDIHAMMNADLVICPYSMLHNKTSLLQRIKWDRVVLDEAHEIRNRQTRTFKAAFKLETGIRWLVTGTPVFNSMEDFVSLCAFLGFSKNTVQAMHKEIKDIYIMRRTKSDGLITHEDLNRYSAVWREAIETSYNGHKVITMPLPSSGGVSLVQLLKGAEQIDMAQWDHNSTSHIHYMTELQRRAYADRAEWLGDPDFVEVDVARLTSPDYIQNRNSDIDAQNKTDSQDIKPGAVSTIESFETTHFSIVDKWRNAVSITTTLNGMFGSKVVVDGAGFFLNNEMDDFSAKPCTPNMFGLVGAEANSILAQKRMLSSMSPTILEKDGELFMVVGSPGGSTIITVVYQSISNVIDYGMSMQEAVDAKKTHSQWLPDVVVLEKGSTNLSTLGNLLSKGHIPIPWPMFPLGLGRVNAILVKDNGSLEGAADDRAEDNFAAGH